MYFAASPPEEGKCRTRNNLRPICRDRPGPLGHTERPVDVAILAFPEVTASVVYGFHDLFHCVGRDWGIVVEGRPGPALMSARVVSSQTDAFVAANGVRIAPDGALDHHRIPDIVCVPEIMVPPGEPLEGRFGDEIAWLKRLPCRRCDARNRLLGRDAARRGGLARWPRRDHPLGVLRRDEDTLPAGARSPAARAGRDR